MKGKILLPRGRLNFLLWSPDTKKGRFGSILSSESQNLGDLTLQALNYKP
jgi:hypothetical protein